jgi:hypothetical protein
VIGSGITGERLAVGNVAGALAGDRVDIESGATEETGVIGPIFSRRAQRLHQSFEEVSRATGNQRIRAWLAERAV